MDRLTTRACRRCGAVALCRWSVIDGNRAWVCGRGCNLNAGAGEGAAVDAGHDGPARLVAEVRDGLQAVARVTAVLDEDLEDRAH